jgi:hypothetical protein
MALPELSPAQLVQAREALTRAAHDLGRYLSFESAAWSPGEDPPELLREALAQDLHHTRRSATGSEDALRLWRRLRPSGLEDEPAVQALDQELPLLMALELERATEAELRRTAARLAQLAKGLRELHRRVLSAP